MPQFNVIIVGSGLAGPLLASGLLAAGVKVDLYEKLAADAKRDGYQIRVAQPCLEAFRLSLSAEQNEEIKARLGHFESNENTTPIWYDHKLKPLLDMGRFSEQYHGSSPMDRVVLRNTIMQTPLKNGIVHFSKSFSGYEIISDDERERVRVLFADGTSADCDLLIGADGSHSRINEQLGLKNIESIPVINFITKTHLSRDKLAALPSAARRSPMLCFSHKKTYFCVAKAFSAKEDASKPAATSDYDEDTATFTFSMQIHKDDCPKDIKNWDKDSTWKFLEESIRTWDDAFRQVIEVIKSEDIYVFEPRATKKPDLNWRSKVQTATNPKLGHPRVWLMGDAIHVMLPNRGMGGNQAMLDTTVLLPLIKRLQEAMESDGILRNEVVAAACKEYEHEMIPRTFYWVEASGGTKAVPFDTSTFSGRWVAWYMKLSLDTRDAMHSILRFFRLV
ncbi:FAD/NAD(P)-binding domain-containing protein [Colletotrichum zoysiae]|uniref:FAD/NAD(P)-binding domain-containing protein n=1 Tax=Colletotrichum zoysiae TaxID=1216348 RepID=A0AAD9LYB3_9PEZI|nr:FAD/NAD(P)-binding domain-containing protein [Colletotrichum zoysiae]